VFKFALTVVAGLLAFAVQTLPANLACAQCHPAETAAFANSAMGRSIGRPVQTVPQGEVRQSESDSVLDIVWVKGTMIHRLKELGLQAEYPIVYQIGAGKVGESYIARIGEYLVQSPASYYRRYGWDVSPGFKDAAIFDFDRVLGDRCLACHSGNQQSSEIGPINCERCHGDSREHLSHPSKANIVNPARLTPRPRDSVCEQCHLEGVARVLNPGKTWRDFHAGEELETTLSVYVNNQPGPSKAVSQAEQLALSKCAQQSNGKLWCGTCHNPHAGKAGNRVSEIKAICGSCHATLTSTNHPTSAIDCVTCHMPRLSPKDVAHSATTDHRIMAIPTQQSSGGPSDAIRAWHEPTTGLKQRNLGLAELEASALPGLHSLGDVGGSLLQQLPVNQRDSDPAVLAALGDIALSGGRLVESESLFRRATQLAPAHAEYAMYLGIVLKQKGDVTEAARVLESAIGIDVSLQRAYLELSALAEHSSTVHAGIATLKMPRFKHFPGLSPRPDSRWRAKREQEWSGWDFFPRRL
jgi:predicted CXXCH cytochrome family protein